MRHGRTAWNATHRYQGQTDIPLDEMGIAQAAAVARGLASERIDVAVTSDLTRARATAEIVLGSRAISLDRDERWREMRFGVWEGLTWAQIAERFPGVEASSPREIAPEGGESFDELCTRVALALDAIVARAQADARVLVATHAGVLHALMRVALGRTEADALGVRFSPASVTRLSHDGEAWTLREINRVYDTEVH